MNDAELKEHDDLCKNVADYMFENNKTMYWALLELNYWEHQIGIRLKVSTIEKMYKELVHTAIAKCMRHNNCTIQYVIKQWRKDYRTINYKRVYEIYNEL